MPRHYRCQQIPTGGAGLILVEVNIHLQGALEYNKLSVKVCLQGTLVCYKVNVKRCMHGSLVYNTGDVYRVFFCK